jgi:iron-sulfur cluster assembly protein
MSDTTQETQEITITENAINALRDVRVQNEIPEDFLLRIGVRGGGCSGMNYAIGFDQEVHESDEVFEFDGLKVIVDPKSMYYLLGARLDYVTTEQGSGFVFENPNNMGSCSCGSSDSGCC